MEHLWGSGISSCGDGILFIPCANRVSKRRRRSDGTLSQIVSRGFIDMLPKRVPLMLLAALACLNFLLRYPSTSHELGVDSFVWHGMATSLKQQDRKSTRLNSSHSQISYAVF